MPRRECVSQPIDEDMHFLFQTCGSLYGMAMAQSSIMFPYLLCAINIDIVPSIQLLRFVHERPHPQRQKRSQCLACHSFFVKTQTNTLHYHAPRTPPSLLYQPSIQKQPQVHTTNKNRKEIVHITAQLRLHVFAKWNALAQASPFAPSISDE